MIGSLYLWALALLCLLGLWMARSGDEADLTFAAERFPEAVVTDDPGDTVCVLFCRGLGTKGGANHPRWPLGNGTVPAAIDSAFKWCNVSYNPTFQDSFYFADKMFVSLAGFETSDDQLPAAATMRYGAMRWNLDVLPRNRRILGAYLCLRTHTSILDFTTRDDIGMTAFLDTMTGYDWWRGVPGGRALAAGDTNHCAASWNLLNWRTGEPWPAPLVERKDWWDWGIPAREISQQGWQNEGWPGASDDSLVLDVTDIVQLYLTVPGLANNGFWIGGYYPGYLPQPAIRCGNNPNADYWQPFLVVYYDNQEYSQPWWGKPLVAMFSTDDQRIDNYCAECGDMTYKAIFDSAGFKYTLFVRGDAIDGQFGFHSPVQMDSAEIHQMWLEGYEIGHHEFYHDYYITPSSPESLAQDIARDRLARAVGIPYRDLKVLAWGYGWWDTHYVRAAIDSGFIGARAVSYLENHPTCCAHADGANYLLWAPPRPADASTEDTVLVYSYAPTHGNYKIWGSAGIGYFARDVVMENVNDAIADCWHRNNMPIDIFWHRPDYDAPWQQISWMIEAFRYKQNILSVKTHGEVLEYYRDPAHHIFCASRDTAHYVCGPEGRAWMCPTPSQEPGLSRVAEDQRPQPALLCLSGNVPNPFNPLTRISYTIPAGRGVSGVSLKVYDLAGRMVRTLVNQPEGPGVHQVAWDGTDDRGASVASGLYLYQLRWQAEKQTRRMLLLR